MTKIDETKQYKFSEIVRMVEDGELPVGTKVAPNGVFDYLLVGKESNVNKLNSADGSDIDMFNVSVAFSRSWTIELPKEDKYYLKLPERFNGDYLKAFVNYDKELDKYTLNTMYDTCHIQTKFTQSEIDAMPFDTNFFKKIKVEDE